MPVATLAELYPAESYFSIKLDKVEHVAKSDTAPEHVLVYGRATDESIDADGEIVDGQFARKALSDWFETGANVRQMHSPFLPPAGKGVELLHADDGVWVRSKVFEPNAIKQVLNGGYTAYSVGLNGVRKIRDVRAPKGRIIDGKCIELSLVDRPSNASCKVELAKSAGYKTDAPLLYLGGVSEELLTEYVDDVTKAADRPDHPVYLLHEHDHSANDGTVWKHTHSHAHADGSPGHDDPVHQHLPSTTVKSHRAPHADPEDHTHLHNDGTVHTHPHDHADVTDADHETHKHVGTQFAKAAVTTHSNPHTEPVVHEHVHTTGDSYVDAGDSHSHPHDHVDGDGGHDGHMGEHGELIPESQKVATARVQKIASPLTADAPDAAHDPDDGTAEKRDFSDKERERLANAGKARPDGSYPITSPQDVENAVRDYNRSNGSPADKQHIIERAKALGKAGTDKLPADWPGSTQDDTSDTSKTVAPTVRKDGVAVALGPTARTLLYQMLQQEVTEDGGTGMECDDIGNIAKAYYHLCAYLEDEAGEADNAPTAVFTSAVPNAIKSLHALTCPFLPMTDVAAKSLDVLRAAQPSLQQLLGLALTADGGKGAYGQPLSLLGELQAHVRSLAPAALPDPGQHELDILTAMTNARKAVGELLTPPTLPPAPSAPPNPSQFRDGFQSNGVAPMQATSAPHIPSGHTGLDASGFVDNTAPTPVKPSSGAPSTVPGMRDANGPVMKADGSGDAPMARAARTYYTNSARDMTLRSLQTIHDNLVALHPDICAAMESSAEEGAKGGFAPLLSSHQPKPLRSSDLPQQSAVPAVVKAARTDVSEADASMLPDSIKALVAEIGELKTVVGQQATRIDAQHTLLEQMASQPDPRVAPYRGSQLYAVDKGSQVAEAQKRARRAELVERAKELDGWLRAGGADPQGRLTAQLHSINEELQVQ